MGRLWVQLCTALGSMAIALAVTPPEKASGPAASMTPGNIQLQINRDSPTHLPGKTRLHVTVSAPRVLFALIAVG